jgi:hypothetical protein
MQFNRLCNKIISSVQNSKEIKKNNSLCVLDDFNSSFYNSLLSKEEFVRFSNFFSEIDIDHPHLGELFSPILDDLNDIYDLYVIVSESNKLNLDLFFEFCSYIKTKKRWFEVLKKIDSPSSNLLNMRLVSDENKRNKLRFNKKVQGISLSSLLLKGSGEWEVIDSDFVFFHINGNRYDKYLSKAKSKADAYDKLGCQFLGDEVRKNSKSFEKLYGFTNHGFRRITMTLAAAILSKTHSYKRQLGDESTPVINVFKSKSFLENLNDVVNLCCRQVASNGGVLDYNLLKPLSYSDSELSMVCEYNPRSYPLHDFWPMASQKLKNMIKILESHPATGGRAIFDSYRVITPSFLLKFPGSHAQLSKKLTDFVLTISEIINPIILGEKNGKCYFVSYWH